MSSAEQNKELVRRWFEVGVKESKHNPAVVRQYLADTYKDNAQAHHQETSIEAMEASLADSHNASDFEMKVLHQVAEGDWVVTHWEMESFHHTPAQRHPTLKHVAPRGKQVGIAGMTLHRVHAGKIAEGWHFDNTLQYALERGELVPAPAATKK